MAFYHDEPPRPDSLLFVAVSQLRDLSRLEFMYDNLQNGVFLAQLAIDIQRIANGSAPCDTAMWRAIAAQFPTLFGKGAQRVIYTFDL